MDTCHVCRFRPGPETVHHLQLPSRHLRMLPEALGQNVYRQPCFEKQSVFIFAILDSK